MATSVVSTEGLAKMLEKRTAESTLLAQSVCEAGAGWFLSLDT